MSICGHDTTATIRGLCPKCYYRAYRKKVRDGVPRRIFNLPPPEDEVPTRPKDVQSETFFRWPTACPHCGKSHALLFTDREATCSGHLTGCGWTGYLVRMEACT